MSYNPKNQLPVFDETNNIKSKYSTKLKISLIFPENSEYTKQEFKDECDINVLMAQYMSTGVMPNLNERSPQYLDCTGMDFQESMNFVAGAQSIFNDLPSTLRNRFNNDPAEFLDFVHNPANKAEMAELGLLRPDVKINLKPDLPASPEQSSPPPSPKPAQENSEKV
ncbi:MAG: internal scaffolding protein [Microviridae sp.]|nr:MAG: internal scaffolding protein [Microviridae sp.]